MDSLIAVYLVLHGEIRRECCKAALSLVLNAMSGNTDEDHY